MNGRLVIWAIVFDLVSLNNRIGKIEIETETADFWQVESNYRLVEELAFLKEKKKNVEVFFDFFKKNEIEAGRKVLKKIIADFCLKDQKHFNDQAVLNIYSGVGGKDAEDWVGLLGRMYEKFFEKEKWSKTIIGSDQNEFGGYKFLSFEVKAPVFGVLNFEKGVHRLVRISPFSSQKLRHTSFAYVEVIPFVAQTNFELDEKDLEFQTFRSSGHGGQNVNKLETAVRVIYRPLQISVVCQSERSQHQNKIKAVEILKSRLGQILEEEEVKELNQLKGGRPEIGWGYQKRSYVMQPYQLVKDHQFNYVTNRLDEVLAGNLDLIHPLGAIL
ncbi:MAG: PCRF domain-containing protein [Patescibacteria group bacterium]|nr:PCRF domain-containing protein [Patescibacteria group bacterium]